MGEVHLSLNTSSDPRYAVVAEFAQGVPIALGLMLLKTFSEPNACLLIPVIKNQKRSKYQI
jgi:hypothetical protein